MSEKQPKIVQKLLLRTFFLLLAIAGVFLGIQKLMDWRKDPDSGAADTSDMIAAVQILNEGQQAVLFDKDAKKTPSPDYVSGKTERDLVWQPDGNRLFMTSDRKEAAFNLFRWNPGANSVDQKGLSTLSRFEPVFPSQADGASKAAANRYVLITQGGLILEMDLKESTTSQVLPPIRGVTMGADEGSGGSGQLDTIYNRFGRSFRTARWIGGGNFIAAVMRRDEGETLIVQRNPALVKEPDTPKGLFGGEKLSVDVDPKSGQLVCSVLAYEFPDPERIPSEFIKNNKVVKPFANGIFAFNPETEQITRIAIEARPDVAFASPAVSPDGTQIAVVVGTWDGTNFAPKALLTMPLQEGGVASASRVLEGAIYEPSWHPNGKTLTYIKRVDGQRAIFTIEKDGSGERRITTEGDYSTPRFSPQVKAAS